MKRRKLLAEPPAEPRYGQAPVNDVELAHFESRLRIDKYDLDTEVAEQPRTFEEVADRLAMAKSMRDEAKDNLKTVEAELSLAFREAGDKKGKKPSEKQLADMVQVSSRRRDVFRLFVEAERMTNKLEGLRDSYRDRGFMLREMCGLSLAAYFGSGEYRGGEIVKHARDVEYEKKRAKIHQEAVARRKGRR